MQLVDLVRTVIRSWFRALAGWLDRITRSRLTPNIVTAVGVIMHVPIALLIAFDQLLLAAVLLFVFGLFDVLDGELARLQKRAGSQGMIFDATTDRLKIALLFTGISYWLTDNGHAKWAFSAVLACGVALTLAYAKAKAEAALALKKNINDHHTLNRYFNERPLDFDILMVIVFAGLLFNQILAATLAIIALGIISLLIIAYSIRKQIK